MVPTTALSPEAVAAARSATQKATGTPTSAPMAKVSMELVLLYSQYRENGAAGVRAVRRAATTQARAKAAGSRDGGGSILVPVAADGRSVAVHAVAVTAPTRLQAELRRLGLRGGAVAGNVVSGRLPLEAVRAAAELSSLRGLLPAYAQVRAGLVGSEADTAHGAFRVRAEQGLDGSGQKVCVLSDSYNRASSTVTAAPDDVQSGDLPGRTNPNGYTTPVDVLEDDDGQDRAPTDEGRAMLQLIHDIAPGAALGFHTAVGGVGTFVEGIRALADPDRGNCTIIVDDIGYNVEPFYQDGPIATAIDEVVQQEGVAYFSAAGNDGDRSYQAPFRNSGAPGVLSTQGVLHDFDPSGETDTRQRITVQPGGQFQIFTLQWTDPSALVEGSAGADTDIDIALLNEEGDIVAQPSNTNNVVTGVPVEGVLRYTNDGTRTQTLDLIVEKQAGPDPDQIKYIYSGQGVSIQEYAEGSPTLYGHPMAEGAMAVAAAPFFNTAAYNTNVDSGAVVNVYTSKGGIDILFDGTGSRLAAPEERRKPDVTGTDVVDNTFFGSDIDIADGDSHPNFAGTSAAAPNVAAIAALMREKGPELPPGEIYELLESTAVDIRFRQAVEEGEIVSREVAAGFDPWSGFGFVDAAAALPIDLFDAQFAEADSDGTTRELTWSVRDGITIQNYDIDRRYFDGPFKDLATPSGPPVQVGSPGLGVYTYRIRWTRGDGTQKQTRVVDTLGFRGAEPVSAQVGPPDAQGRPVVTLSWAVPPGKNTSNFSYEVERRTGTEGAFRVLADTSETSITIGRQAPGTYAYRVTARDGDGNTITSAATSVSVGFEGAAAAIGPYPNPTRTTAHLNLTAQQAQPVTVEVYDVLGQRVYREQCQLGARAPTPFAIDVASWSSGVYVLRVRGREFTITRKLVVRK